MTKETKKKKTPPKSRKRVIIEWSVQLLLLLAMVVGITAWQTRRMVKTGEPAPPIALSDLEGNQVSFADHRGQKVVLYFFAPWCSVCHASSGNANALRAATSTDDVAIYAVGLGWESVEELRRFAEKHALTVPVLIGTEQTAADYRVDSFPSVYILDAQHRIAHRLVGYTTEWGLRFRTAVTSFF